MNCYTIFWTRPKGKLASCQAKWWIRSIEQRTPDSAYPRSLLWRHAPVKVISTLLIRNGSSPCVYIAELLAHIDTLKLLAHVDTLKLLAHIDRLKLLGHADTLKFLAHIDTLKLLASIDTFNSTFSILLNIIDSTGLRFLCYRKCNNVKNCFTKFQLLQLQRRVLQLCSQ